MKPAHDIFLTVGVPIAGVGKRSFENFRAFAEADIEAIQDEAFKAGLTRSAVIADGYLQSMGSRDGMKVAALIKDEIVEEMDRPQPNPAKGLVEKGEL